MTAPVSQFSEDDFSGRAYAAILPRTGTDYAAQTADIAEQIQQHFNRATGKTVVRQTIFFRDPAQLDNIAALLTQAFSGSLPQTAFVAQAPADGSLIAAEITAAKNSEIEQRSANLTLEHRNGITWVHTHADALQGGKAPGSNSYADTLAVLQSNLAALQQGGATLAQVFRPRQTRPRRHPTLQRTQPRPHRRIRRHPLFGPIPQNPARIRRLSRLHRHRHGRTRRRPLMQRTGNPAQRRSRRAAGKSPSNPRV